MSACLALSPGATIAQALRHGAAVLQAALVDSPALDARLLLAHAMGLDQATLLRSRQDPAHLDRFLPLLARRAVHEPVALIRGHQEFWSLDFAVSPATLIPRPDSETLIEAAMAARPDPRRVRRILDLGTGTGCLLCAALTVFPDAWGLGIDRVPEAAALAAANARALGLQGRAAFIAGDWATALQARFDLVLANPPYIRAADIATLMPDVRQFEPRRALDGGPDGLDAYRALLAAMPGLLAPDGLGILELGIGQASFVAALADAAGLDATSRPDLAGIPRALLVEKTVGTAAAPG